jgi:hypothetical protein
MGFILWQQQHHSIRLRSVSPTSSTDSDVLAAIKEMKKKKLIISATTSLS